MFPKANEVKEHGPDEKPVVIVQHSLEKKKWSSKKYILIGGFGVIMIALILTGILVGMHLFTEAQKELVEYTLKLKDGRSQDVSSDVSSNIVKYHVRDDDHESWVVNDFNTDIKVTKIITRTETSCYITPLNRSTAMEPSKVTKPENSNIDVPSKSNSIVYIASGSALSDISFLNKVAEDMCKGVSTYWMYPSCGNDFIIPDSPLPQSRSPLQKREAPYYVLSRLIRDGVTNICVNGCCKTVCSPCPIKYSWLFLGMKMYCNWVMSPNCTNFQFCSPTPKLNCAPGKC